MPGFVRHTQQFEWIDLIGHKNAALTKLLINPISTGQSQIDLQISSYAPQGHALEHTHAARHECFYFISGEGVFDLDGVRSAIGPNTVAYVPPGIKHQIINTGFDDLMFVIVGADADLAFYEGYDGFFVDAAKHEPDQTGPNRESGIR